MRISDWSSDVCSSDLDYRTEEVGLGLAEVEIELKYNEGAPVIQEIARVSRPGRRVYSKIRELPRVYNGLGITILSTPRGVMSDQEARTANVGGRSEEHTSELQ